MIGLLLAIIIFNSIAFLTNKRLTASQIVQIWTFTVALQGLFDMFVELHYHGYWYFTKGIDWADILPHTLLIPPVNMMFLNWYPFHKPVIKRFSYIVCWVIAILLYEMVTLLPEPWGYFHYGWWTIWWAVIIDPLLFLLLLRFYTWIVKLEQRASSIIK